MPRSQDCPEIEWTGGCKGVQLKAWHRSASAAVTDTSGGWTCWELPWTTKRDQVLEEKICGFGESVRGPGSHPQDRHEERRRGEGVEESKQDTVGLNNTFFLPC